MADLSGQRFSVLGLARSGLAAANWLARHGAEVVASDTREAFDLPLDDLDPRVDLRPSQNFVRPGDTVVISPGIKPGSSAWRLAHAEGREVISDIELFFRHAPCPIVAITGTDGKSTTTALIGHLLAAPGRKVFVGGNIGEAAMGGLDGLGPDDVAVLEVSCFQLVHCYDFNPTAAVVTNIAEDHVEYHGSMAAYIAAKQRIFRNMGPGRTLVVNGDDPEIASWALPPGVEVRRFGWRGRTAGVALAGEADGRTIFIDGRPLVDHSRLRIKGLHNVENALAALLAVEGRFARAEELEPGLLSFAGLEHRMEFVAEIDGVSYYNDSKATNPHAAMAVVNAFEQERFWLLAGGSEKGSDFSEMGRLIAQRTAGAILYGQTRERIAETIPAGHPVELAMTLGQALERAAELARPGEMVILAPACASFDQFNDFEHRGREFKRMVQELAARQAAGKARRG